MHFDGTGVPKNELLGAQLFQRACDGGEPLGCWSVSVGYRDGRGVPKNPSRASEFAARACSGGVAEACLGPEPKLDLRALEAKCTEGVGAPN
jgi:TPR repeat protein